jgi:phospholipid/cholesterol/gamma-HCH transport system ATP-binding protein
MSAPLHNVIEVEGLKTQFGSHVVHENLDFSVQRGEILGLVGGSGSGKSVLLNSILGLLTPSKGTVRVLGIDVHRAREADKKALERRWGVLFQYGALFSSLDVRQNVAAPMKEQSGLSQERRNELADLKIALVGLPAHAGAKKPSELSGGMRKRAGLARALALDPEIVFLDEPTAGLDPIGAAAFDQLILKLRNALGFTVVMVTHDLDSLHTICDRVAVLAERRVVATAPIDELVRLGHPWIDEYFGGPRGRAALREGHL